MPFNKATNKSQQEDFWDSWLFELSPGARRHQDNVGVEPGPKQHEPAWQVLFVNDLHPTPQLRRCHSLESLLSLLRVLAKDPTTYYGLSYGLPAYLAKSPQGDDRRYFVHPDGNLYPLFDAVENLVIDATGAMSDEDAHLGPVATTSREQKQQDPFSGSYFEEDGDEFEEDPDFDPDDLEGYAML